MRRQDGSRSAFWIAIALGAAALTWLLVDVVIAQTQTPKEQALIRLSQIQAQLEDFETKLELLTVDFTSINTAASNLRALIEAIDENLPPAPPTEVRWNLRLEWTPPTTNSDGTNLDDLAGYEAYLAGPGVGATETEFVRFPTVDPFLVREYVAGNYRAFVHAVDLAGNKSDPTPILNFVVPLDGEPPTPPPPDPEPEPAIVEVPVLRWERSKLRWGFNDGSAIEMTIIYLAGTTSAVHIAERRSDGTLPGNWGGAQRGQTYEATGVDGQGRESARSNRVTVP